MLLHQSETSNTLCSWKVEVRRVEIYRHMGIWRDRERRGGRRGERMRG